MQEQQIPCQSDLPESLACCITPCGGAYQMNVKTEKLTGGTWLTTWTAGKSNN